MNAILNGQGDQSGKKTGIQRTFLFWIILGLALFVLRGPLYLQNLNGEEGLFAFLSYNDWPQMRNLIGASINGTKYYVQPEHPIAMYYVFRSLGACVHLLTGDKDPRVMVAGIRAALSLLNIIVFIFLCVIAEIRLVPERSRGVFRAMCSVFLSVLYVSFTAAHLQTEGAVGLAFFAAALSFIILSDRPGKYWLAVFGGIIIGLGKNEWSMVFIAAAAVFLVLKKIISAEKAPWIWTMLAGLLLGNLMSYLIDPFNYMAGFDVMRRITHSTASVSLFKKSRYAGNTILLFTVPILITAVIVFNNGLKAAFSKKYHQLAVFSGICIAGILAAYFNAYWLGGGERFPRYFAISFPFFIVIFGALGEEPVWKWRTDTLKVITVIMVLLNIYLHARLYYREKLTVSGQESRGSYAEAQAVKRSAQKDCIYFTGPDVGFYLNGIDFANKDMGDFYKNYTKLKACP